MSSQNFQKKPLPFVNISSTTRPLQIKENQEKYEEERNEEERYLNGRVFDGTGEYEREIEQEQENKEHPTPLDPQDINFVCEKIINSLYTPDFKNLVQAKISDDHPNLLVFVNLSHTAQEIFHEEIGYSSQIMFLYEGMEDGIGRRVYDSLPSGITTARVFGPTNIPIFIRTVDGFSMLHLYDLEKV